MLLDRFRTAQRHKDPDPLVRLAHIVEMSMTDRETIGAVALEDDDARVRKAAVTKLLDPALLGRIAANDPSDEVRAVAAGMLRDIALDAFEEAGEAEALDAVDAIQDSKLLAQVAKSAGRDIVALRAVSRLSDVKAFGSVARHAVVEAARRAAFEHVRERADREELLSIALNGEFKDTAAMAVDTAASEREWEHIAERARNKAAVKRARQLLKEAADARSREAADKTAAPTPEPAVNTSTVAELMSGDNNSASVEAPPVDMQVPVAAEASALPSVGAQETPAQETPASPAGALAPAIDSATETRLVELVESAERALTDGDTRQARRTLRIVRGEWRDLTLRVAPSSELVSRLDDVDRRIAAREAEARELEERGRRENLKRVQQLAKRVDALVGDTPAPASGKPGLHALERALRDVRTMLSALPPLPTKADADDAAAQLRAAQAVLTPRVQELREANEWQQWANVTIQEQLCARMEALAGLEDPERIASEVKVLQQEWRSAANVPLAKADALWRRFKAAHDVVWPRCEAHFQAQAEQRADHLTKKLALCERAEALAESSNWIQTADEIKRLQAEWKTIGPVARSQEKVAWDRFHAACNRFFTRRHDDLAQRKTVWAANLARKVALCEQAERLGGSTEWDAAAAQLKQLQAEWRTIGPVRKNKSDAIWQRFRAASDDFFTRYAHRHDAARAERIAAREALCSRLEQLAGDELTESPADLAEAVQTVRREWQQEILRPLDPATARGLDDRFAVALSTVIERWPTAFSGGEFDVSANREKMETLIRHVEDVAHKLTTPAAADSQPEVSPTTKLAAMLKEALAANTIGGKVDPRAEEEGRLRAAAEEVRRAQAAWSRVGFVPTDVRRTLTDRFDRAARGILQRAGGSAASTRPAHSDRAPRRH